MKLLVASIFCEGKEVRNREWYATQLKFLSRNTDYFEHVVYKNGDFANGFFSESKVIGSSPVCTTNTYILGVNKIISYFESMQKNFDYFLLLDSDAFPVRNNWLECIDDKMRDLDKWWASPMRFENLDTFPHLSAALIRAKFINKWRDFIDPDVSYHTNIYGRSFEEVGASNSIFLTVNKHIWLPLIRSNVWNPHPVMCAIYDHLFYHHGAGSRFTPGGFRAWARPNYQASINKEGDFQKELFADSNLFVNKLMGKRNILLY